MIYILEDDEGIRKLILYTLEKENMKAKGFDKPSSFFKELEVCLPDLILLDIMLPEEDGLSVLKKLKGTKEYEDIPVIMLTAKSSEYDKVVGLNMGADDYIGKPFGIMELVARIKANLRQSKRVQKEEVLSYKDLSVSIGEHKVRVKNKDVVLTKKEFDILSLLLSNIGIVYTREMIISAVWGYDFEDSSRTVDVHIRTLRSKLKEAGSYIITIRGIGYKLGDKENG